MVHFVILMLTILLKDKYYIIFSIYKRPEFIMFWLYHVYLHFEESTALENVSLLF